MPHEDAFVTRHLSEDELGLECANCCNLHLMYVGDCSLLEEIEAKSHKEEELETARKRVLTSRQAWILAAEMVMKAPAFTYRGLRNKALVLRGLLREVADNNLQGVSAALTFIDEIERVLNDCV